MLADSLARTGAAVAGLPPSSYYLASRDRVRLDQLAARVAHYLDERFLWLDFQDPHRPDERRVRELEYLLGPGHLRCVYDSGRVRGNDPAANHGFWSLIRPDEDEKVIEQITDFVRLPELLQRLLEEVGARPAPRALVLANVERLSSLTSLGPSYFRSMNRALNRAGVTTIGTECGRGAAQRYGFDFELMPAPPAAGRPSPEALVCVRGGIEDCLIFRGFPKAMIACRREVGPAGIGPWEGCATRAALWQVIPVRHRTLRLPSERDLPDVVA